MEFCFPFCDYDALSQRDDWGSLKETILNVFSPAPTCISPPICKPPFNSYLSVSMSVWAPVCRGRCLSKRTDKFCLSVQFVYNKRVFKLDRTFLSDCEMAKCKQFILKFLKLNPLKIVVVRITHAVTQIKLMKVAQVPVLLEKKISCLEKWVLLHVCSSIHFVSI